MTLPLAVLATLLTKGPRCALDIAGLGVSVPGVAASAYVRQVHRLPEDAVQRACRFAVLIVAAALFTAGVLVVVWLCLS